MFNEGMVHRNPFHKLQNDTTVEYVADVLKKDVGKKS